MEEGEQDLKQLENYVSDEEVRGNAKNSAINKQSSFCTKKTLIEIRVETKLSEESAFISILEEQQKELNQQLGSRGMNENPTNNVQVVL